MTNVFGQQDGRTAVVHIGQQGPPGPRANTTLTGLGPPAVGLGLDGDVYFDITNFVFYGPRSGGIWPNGFDLGNGSIVAVLSLDFSQSQNSQYIPLLTF